jgi:hypothetical protein
VLPVSLAPEARCDAAAEGFALSPSREFNREREKGMAGKSKHATTDIVRLIREIGYRHSTWQVFSDFCEMAALSLSNAVDLAQFETREQRYLEIVKRYETDEVKRFPEMLAALTQALEEKTGDVLGRTFHELELHNKWSGQFFTPFPLCQMMAKMTLADEADVRARIAARGFLTAAEPAAGSGAMVIALADTLRDMGINYQRHLHVTATDVDAKCVHMAYVQFALLHIPAVIVHGNSLSLEEYGHWYTPAHILGGWRSKLNRAAVQEPGEHEIAAPAPENPEPRDSEVGRLPPSQLTLF